MLMMPTKINPLMIHIVLEGAVCVSAVVVGRSVDIPLLVGAGETPAPPTVVGVEGAVVVSAA